MDLQVAAAAPAAAPLRLQRENHIRGSNTTLGYDDVAQPPHLEVDFDMTMGENFGELKERPFEKGSEWESRIFFWIFLHLVVFVGTVSFKVNKLAKIETFLVA